MEYNNNNRGALWLTKAKKTGQTYMRGEVIINGQKYYLSVFKNNKKQSEKHPDYNIVINLPQQNKTINQVNQTFNDPYKESSNIEFADNKDQDIPF